MPRRIAIVALLACLVRGCSTWRVTAPQRTGIEQLLISKAADQAAQQLTIDLKPGTKVFVNADTFEGYDQKYALGAIRTRVLQSGASLVNDKGQADVIMDARAGALPSLPAGDAPRSRTDRARLAAPPKPPNPAKAPAGDDA